VAGSPAVDNNDEQLDGGQNNMTVKVGINGFGRIGRIIARNWAGRLRHGEKVPWDIVAVNDITTPKIMEHTLKYDTIYHKFDCELDEAASEIQLKDLGKKIKLLSYRDPAELPWKDMGVDVVIESTGIFTDRPGCEKHLKAGAKKVFISAPGKGDGPDLTVVHGVNHELYDPKKHNIISNASCTTNCLAPVAKVLHEGIGIEAGLMTTIHAYTHDQNLVDGIHKDLRRARAAAINMVPTSTGAAKAVGLVIPALKGKLTGYAVRVPVPTVSFVDLTCWMLKATKVEEINSMMKAAAEGPMKGIISYETEPKVSSDFIGSVYSSNFDSEYTQVVCDKMVKVIAWYDNEWGYVQTMNDIVTYVVNKGL
jgi:glyceraldehyde 3-phosphate dehydrogenase